MLRQNRLKKLLWLVLVPSFVYCNSNSFILAQNSPKISSEPIASAQNIEAEVSSKAIPTQLEENIKASVTDLYGKDKAEIIYANILNIVKDAKTQRSLALKQSDSDRSSDWYKDEIVYMFYADQFGVKDKNTPNTFKNLIGMLDYLHDLGVTTIYILPFLDSPMGDAGFDVRDPRNVRKDLGGMEEFQQFADAARAKGFKIKADLILNHFSDQHQWFQDALKGDLQKLNYFIATDKPPVFKKYHDEKMGVVVDYTEDNGSVSKRRLIFPDICENNYRKVSIKGKDYYVYHTFYPFQLDVNWENPEVLYYMLNTIAYWANNGIDIFRLDAIPFFIKEKGTNGENRPKTHAVIRLLSSFLQSIAPRSVFQAEACQWPKDILPYFGQENTYSIDNSKKLTRTDEVQIAYNFPFMPAIWASLVTADKEHFWKAFKETPEIPKPDTWAIFLRVHDELTLEMVDSETRKMVYDKLISKGAEFREGFGVSGRIANFLDNNPVKIGLAFSVLLSLPGIPIIYYGDEIGAQNNLDYAKDSAKQREEMQKAKGTNLEVKSYFDSRDINRGPVTKDMFYSAMHDNSDNGNLNSKVYRTVKNLIKKRKENSVLTKGSLSEVKSDKENIFSYLRKNDNQCILVVNNLSDKTLKSNLDLSKDIVSRLNKKPLLDSISDKPIDAEITASGLKITLEPYQSFWIKLYDSNKE
ncbi:MAG: alpha-glucosidase C-terminal domain-containing protein [Candidatus Riflebacteria bacterium]|nr:alpha-glucosidase C-terminal domain-containing protein [Candidatus Riflebacteria bacterium]